MTFDETSSHYQNLSTTSHPTDGMPIRDWILYCWQTQRSLAFLTNQSPSSSRHLRTGLV